MSDIAAPPAAGPLATPPAAGPLDAVKRRVRSGELGAWPVVIGLIVIWTVFQILNDRFLTPENLSNLALQIVGPGIISVGIVLVLLLGEIDLSAGSVAGLGAATLAVLTVRQGIADVPAILLVLAMGLLIGCLQGGIFAKLGVPAFIVTLAGNLGWQGLQLFVLKPEGTINIPYDGFIAKLSSTFLTSAAGWIIGILVIAAYAAAVLVDHARRTKAGLPTRSMVASAVRIGGVAVIVLATLLVLGGARGVPLSLLILVGIVAIVDLVLRRTRYGRGIFAVGGNAEAARRAGLNVAGIRISVFALCSMFAALGGIMIASRGFSAGQSTGAGDVLLLSIAAAVIGGVSLFGGRGSTYGALLGSLVLGSISNGMFLLSLDSSVRYMITAAVLLAAVILDALSRRGRRSSGRE
ncbi:D-xylose transport system permease protein [Allocatelliglobosispora scoriae]|uniref:Xylose transport system permease protein XylH n=1 Tax=Allocatelliglobosispora scoriae TaxID=643052 RepID=A0A841BKA1_9ACTN|nr:sugar ABC transporter permease [Allocatelliglobosispora scoriae]MBB5867609.1 D-xylose transport system permease protein [Allocatelliglobosispora scoriae]